MSKTDFLNIDDLAPSVRKVIKIEGQEHPYVEPSVETFIAETRRAREIDEEHGNEPPTEVVIEASIDFIAACFPSLPEGALRKLNFRQIAAIKEFLDAEVEPDEATKKAAAKATKKAGKESAEGNG